ncbi:hypothetical protein PCL_00930 [Purpureocillium lilacinum]|uniref:Uncharacterized protein n=1 Tax=Purpureocillium lilacinum TaxID=33203 RepID=A0A2U3E444_PURLI|nr:hypothetical protein PCL_00930 [Purpureocillium lilacinum]
MGGFFMGGAWGLGERATCKARGFGSFGLGGARAAGQGGSSKLSLLFTCLGWSWTLIYLRSVVWSREGMNGITEARKSGIANGREWAQMQGKSADRAIPRDPVTDSKLQAKAARRRLASLLIRDEKSARRKRKTPPSLLPMPHRALAGPPPKSPHRARGVGSPPFPDCWLAYLHAHPSRRPSSHQQQQQQQPRKSWPNFLRSAAEARRAKRTIETRDQQAATNGQRRIMRQAGEQPSTGGSLAGAAPPPSPLRPAGGAQWLQPAQQQPPSSPFGASLPGPLEDGPFQRRPELRLQLPSRWESSSGGDTPSRQHDEANCGAIGTVAHRWPSQPPPGATHAQTGRGLGGHGGPSNCVREVAYGRSSRRQVPVHAGWAGLGWAGWMDGWTMRTRGGGGAHSLPLTPSGSLAHSLTHSLGNRLCTSTSAGTTPTQPGQHAQAAGRQGPRPPRAPSDALTLCPSVWAPWSPSLDVSLSLPLTLSLPSLRLPLPLHSLCSTACTPTALLIEADATSSQLAPARRARTSDIRRRRASPLPLDHDELSVLRCPPTFCRLLVEPVSSTGYHDR